MTARLATGLLLALVACGDDASSDGATSAGGDAPGSSAIATSSAAAGAGGDDDGDGGRGGTTSTGDGGDPAGGGGIGGAGGDGGTAGHGGQGAGGAPVVAPPLLSLVAPAAGTALGSRTARVHLAVSSATAATVTLAIGGAVVDVVDVEDGDTTPSLVLPLDRGPVAYVARVTDAGGQWAEVEGSLHGGATTAASLDGLAVLDDGALVRWGEGSATPTRLAGVAFTSIAPFGDAWAAIDATGRVVVIEGDVVSPLAGGDVDARHLAVGGGHVLVLTADGRVLAAGSNGAGQLGLGTTTPSQALVAIPDLEDVIAIAASSEASFAITGDGLLYAWGSNAAGLLGQGDEDGAAHPEPRIVPLLEDVIGVAAGRDHVLALRGDGALFAWGEGASGQLGDGSSGFLASAATPLLVPPVDDRRVVAPLAGLNGSGALLADGTTLAWGQNGQAQLGVGDTATRTRPVPTLLEAPVLGVALSGAGGVAMRPGVAIGWGSNGSAQLGLPLPPEGPSRSAVPVVLPWP